MYIVAPHQFIERRTMGNSSTKKIEDESVSGMPQNQYGNYAGNLMSKPAIEGGCDCSGGFIGGDDLNVDSIADYPSSVNFMTKEKLVGDILRIFEELNIKAEGATTKEKVNSIINQIPSAKKDGPQFVAKAESHKKLCSRIAEKINQVVGNKIIDPAAEPAVVCKQIAEVVSSLKYGMHIEFLVVRDETKKSLKNLVVLKSLLDDLFGRIEKRISASEDAKLGAKIAKLSDLHKMTMKEVDRQIEMLKNTLNITLMPGDDELNTLIKNDDALKGMLSRLEVEVKPGDPQFGEIIAKVLIGVGTTATTSEIINEALKKYGITVDEYAKMTSKGVSDAVAKTLMDKDLSGDDLQAYLDAAKIISSPKNISSAASIRDMLKQSAKKGGEEEDSFTFDIDGEGEHHEEEEQFEGEDEHHVEGGAKEKEWKSRIDKRIQAKRSEKRIIFRAFNQNIVRLFDAIIISVNELADKIGVGIPLSDKLDAFRNALNAVDNTVMRKNSYYALIGYYSDALSMQYKDDFLAQLQYVSSCVDDIVAMDMYKNVASHFKDVQGRVLDLVKLIDEYSTKVSAKYGVSHGVLGGDDEEAEECAFVGGFHEEMQALQGGESHEGDEHMPMEGEGEHVEGGRSSLKDEEKLIDNVVSNTALKISDAIKKFDYYFRVSQIKENLKHMGPELENYGEGYEDMRAQAIARKIDEVRGWFDNKIKDLGDPSKYAYYAEGGGGHAEAKYIKNFLEKQKNPVVKLWRTVEAIDEYMKVFTNSMVNNPEDIKDIKDLLDEVEVIYDWYDDSTGDALIDVFEMFPKSDGTLSKFYRADKDNYLTPPRPTNTLEFSNTYIIPLNGNYVEDGTFKGFNDIRLFLNKFMLVKNLVNVFVHTGRKFNDKTLDSHAYMPVTEMYKNICDFIVFCSHTINNEKPKGQSKIEKAMGKEMALKQDKRTLEQLERDLKKFRKYLITVEKDYDDKWRKYKVAIKGLDEDHIRHILESEIDLLDNHDKKIRELSEAMNMALHHYKMNAATHASLSARIKAQKKYKSTSNPQQSIATVQKEDAERMYNVKLLDVKDVMNLEKNYNPVAEANIYFVKIIKCMASKILTVVGMYDVFKRPDQHNGFDATRQIIGAGDELPPIEPDAAELYFRLPYLARFYKEIFDFNAGKFNSANLDEPGFVNDKQSFGKDKLRMITLVPEVEGIFSGLINLIFQKQDGYEFENYTDDQHAELITEINSIYAKMKAKHGEKVIMETIYEFVNEVNRRYGVITQKERDLFNQEIRDRVFYDYKDISKKERSFNTNLLPGEEDIEYERETILPSKKYETPGSSTVGLGDKRVSPYKIKKASMKMFKNLRCMLDYRYRVTADDPYRKNKTLTSGFRPTIKSVQTKLKIETDPRAKFNIVSNMLSGGKMDNINRVKHVMFHETVVAGLTALSKICSDLMIFKRAVITCDLKYLNDNKIMYGYVNRAYTDASANLHFTGAGANTANESIILRSEAAQILLAGSTTKMKKEARKIMLAALLSVANDSNGLIELRTTNSISIDASKLVKHIKSMFSNIKYFADKLRTFIPKADYDEYMNKKEVGTFYWLHEQLMEKIIVGRPAKKDAKGNILKPAYLNFNDLNKKLKSIFDNKKVKLDWILKEKYPYALQADGNPATDSFVNLARSKAIYTASEEDIIDTLMMENHGTYIKVIGTDHVIINSTRSKQDGNNDIVHHFNITLRKYIEDSFDESVNKIHKSSINDIISRSGADIMEYADNSITDTLYSDHQYAVEKFIQGKYRSVGGAGSGIMSALQIKGNDASKLKSAVLYRSNALVLRNLYTNVNAQNQTSVYLADSMAELSTYQRDKMRSKLPLLKNEFSIILETAKKLHYMIDHNLITVDVNENRTAMLNKLAIHCTAIITCINNVMREISAKSTYLELYEGFTNSYKESTKRFPLAPPSASGLLFDEYDTRAANKSGNRLLFIPESQYRHNIISSIIGVGDDAKLSDFPWFEDIVKSYNTASESSFALEKPKIETMLRDLFAITKYSYRVYLSSAANNYSYLRSVSGAAVASNKTYETMVNALVSHPASLTEKLDKYHNTIMSENQEFHTTKIAERVSSSASNVLDPKDVIIDNIVDLNIVPVNVHAMMRDIPLANLYNYEWTFDRIAVEQTYGYIRKEIGDAKTNERCNNEGTMIVDNPYKKEFDHADLIYNLFYGGFEQGKFIVDHIQHRLLFNAHYNISSPKKYKLRSETHNTSTDSALFGGTDKRAIKSIGKVRFNKILLRNVMFSINVYRLIRFKLHSDLMYDDNIKVKSHSITRPDVTEFYTPHKTHEKLRD